MPKQWGLVSIACWYLWILAFFLTLLRILNASPHVFFFVVCSLLLVFTISNAVLAFSHRVSAKQALILIFLSAVVSVFVYAALYTRFHLWDERAKCEIKDFLTSLYFSIITFSSVGFGDLQPLPNHISRLVAATEAISGYAYLAFTIGICLQMKEWNSSSKDRSASIDKSEESKK